MPPEIAAIANCLKSSEKEFQIPHLSKTHGKPKLQFFLLQQVLNLKSSLMIELLWFSKPSAAGKNNSETPESSRTLLVETM
jgi:hypothetical protein